MSPAVGRSKSAPAAPTRMQTPGRREAEFIGRITASATHELRNVLAIVKESAGLISDLVRAFPTGSAAPNADRLLKAAGRIDAQVTRGADIVTHLNRFAHSMDEDVRRIDLDEEVRQVAFLSQRLARAKSQAVQATHADEPVWLTGNSLHVQMALHAAVAFCLEYLAEGTALEVRAGHEERGLRCRRQVVRGGHICPVAGLDCAPGPGRGPRIHRPTGRGGAERSPPVRGR